MGSNLPPGVTIADLDEMYLQCCLGGSDEPQRGIVTADTLRLIASGMGDDGDRWRTVADECPVGCFIEIGVGGVWSYGSEA